MCLYFCSFFFFSSRRRHTRYWRDWSSDVCSSDLTDVLLEAVKIDAGDEGSVHDMGGNILPMLTEGGCTQVYDFADNTVPGETERDHGYWRDVGTLDAYYDAHMDLIAVHPVFNLYNRKGPILTSFPPLPPAKFV